MSRIFVAKGDVFLGSRRLDKDGNVIAESEPIFDESEGGSCVVIGRYNPNTGEDEDNVSVYADFSAYQYLSKILNEIAPGREPDIPDFKQIFCNALADKVDLCEYCPSRERCGSFMNARGCIVNEWRWEEDNKCR